MAAAQNPNGASWSFSEIETLHALSMAEPRLQVAAMARRLNRTASAVQTMLTKSGLIQLRYDKIKTTQAKVRRCLTCDSGFLSVSFGNRMCYDCRRLTEREVA
jgi:hypothetical protein